MDLGGEAIVLIQAIDEFYSTTDQSRRLALNQYLCNFKTGEKKEDNGDWFRLFQDGILQWQSKDVSYFSVDTILPMYSTSVLYPSMIQSNIDGRIFWINQN